MKKKFTITDIIFLFPFIIGFGIGVSYFIYGIIDDNYKKNEYLRMDKVHFLERENPPIIEYNPDVILRNNKMEREYMNATEEERKNKSDGICGLVSKIALVGDYYIGYITGEKYINCKGYFYMKKGRKSSDYRLNLTENDIEQKFGKNIKYINPSKFINKYGKGGNYDTNFIDLITISVILTLFCFIVLWVVFRICELTILGIIFIINKIRK